MQYPNALSPIRVGKFVFKNRIEYPPSRSPSIHNGAKIPTDEAMAFWTNRAKSGVGLVTVTGVGLDNDWEDRWELSIKKTRDRLTTMVESIHYYGAKASMELTGYFFKNYGVSPGSRGMFGGLLEEIPVDEMMRYRDRYVEVAGILKKLGFDGIFLHFGHSTPLAQFLSPYSNKRTDQYGGCFENRTRYVLDILSAVRETVGNDMFIEARLSGTELQAGGIDLDEGLRMAELFSPYLDILQCSAGMHNPDWMAHIHASGFRPRLPNSYVADTFKKSGRVDCKITAMGAIRDLADAEKLISSGSADFAAICRAIIADPEMIPKCASGRIEDVVPCIQCMRCHDTAAYGGHHQCAVNPKAGMEFWMERLEAPAKSKKKVAVIGGGPAGMKAALTAAERGHDVDLYEMTDALGGIMKYAEHVSFKYPHARYIGWMVKQVEKSSVNVKMNTRATPEMIKSGGYDVVISAIGSEPIIPQVPGVEHAVTAIQAHGMEKKLGENIVIIGGGQVGVELAVHLNMIGKKCTVLESRREIIPDASPTQRGELFVEVRNSGVKIINFATCTAIEPGKVTYDHDGVTKTIEADDVILAAGMKAKTVESDSFMNVADSFVSAGDCNEPRLLEWATKEGFYAANNL
ncbi:MAG: FAD-dependent oxidoreductase [Oscillospiraceae bacterium]|nr:FAD-dependent oxidoreductase [Oscillospiraceae bacterium]